MNRLSFFVVKKRIIKNFIFLQVRILNPRNQFFVWYTLFAVGDERESALANTLLDEQSFSLIAEIKNKEIYLWRLRCVLR